uniref:Uncharacterized protein n=1 Tax=Ixodes ricinus TaxID=34613 RepID=A0A6B0UL46_IXORI
MLSGTLALPFGVTAATKSSTVVVSTSLSLKTSLQCALSSSLHPHSTSLVLRSSFNRSRSPLLTSFSSMVMLMCRKFALPATSSTFSVHKIPGGRGMNTDDYLVQTDVMFEQRSRS